MNSALNLPAEEGGSQRRSEFLLSEPRTKLIAAFAAFLLMLTGCTVGPDYHPPRSTLPSAWSSSLSGGITNEPVNAVEWWKSFRDSELDWLISEAARTNLNLRIAEARVREARAERAIET